MALVADRSSPGATLIAGRGPPRRVSRSCDAARAQRSYGARARRRRGLLTRGTGSNSRNGGISGRTSAFGCVPHGREGRHPVPVVDRGTRRFLGLVALDDLLQARARHLEEERRRERPLKFRFFFPG